MYVPNPALASSLLLYEACVYVATHICGGVGEGVNFAHRYYALYGREVARRRDVAAAATYERDVAVLFYCAGSVPGPTCLMLYVRTWAWKMRLRFIRLKRKTCMAPYGSRRKRTKFVVAVLHPNVYHRLNQIGLHAYISLRVGSIHWGGGLYPLSTMCSAAYIPSVHAHCLLRCTLWGSVYEYPIIISIFTLPEFYLIQA